ncbi:MAG: hypothetical protein G01um101425_661 [Candidatus Peregrinibacteria bacterium Gr01-1014_25]|nr:MAG: hypothetical protein G01um101425_661 [Candidatus Peregrinibacteria bacterium Gr01-1014_25]
MPTKHRHLIALPLFLVLAAVPVLADAHLRLQAMTTEVQQWRASDEPVPASLPGGHRALLSPEAALAVIGEDIAIEKGSVLFLAGTKPLRVDAGMWRVAGVDGAMHITRAGQSITVAGITSPAVVSQGAYLAAVPIGMQWKTSNPLPTAELLAAWHTARRVQHLPQAFLERAIREAHALGDSAMPIPIDTHIAFDDASLWLLASIHPLHWEQAWLAAQPESVDAHLLRVLLFPQADGAQKAAPERIRTRWETAAREIIDASKEPDVLLAFILGETDDAIARFKESGYPERAENYREAAQTLRAAYRPIAREENKDTKGTKETEATKETKATEDEIAVSPADARTVADVRSVLENIGAMFTVQSRFLAMSDGSIRVAGAVFGTKQGDQAIDLTLDRERSLVSNVSRGGKNYPNVVTLEQLRAWMRGE